MKRIICALAILATIISCTSVNRLSFSCSDPSVDIYLNGEYAGRDLVTHVFPQGSKDVEVTCIDNGVEVYHRTFYADGHRNNELIDITVQRDFQYSNGINKAKTR